MENFQNEMVNVKLLESPLKKSFGDKSATAKGLVSCIELLLKMTKFDKIKQNQTKRGLL